MQWQRRAKTPAEMHGAMATVTYEISPRLIHRFKLSEQELGMLTTQRATLNLTRLLPRNVFQSPNISDVL